jgi:hypothetical protein
MFNVSYDYAKQEVARRHERLVAAQRSGAAYEFRPRQPSRLLRAVRWFQRTRPAGGTAPAAAQGEPCLEC